MNNAEANPIAARESGLALALIILYGAVLSLAAPTGGAFFCSDAPRHALNGVFVMDLVRTVLFDDPSGCAYHYHAQYPALAILYYPPLFYFLSAPFFWVFGVSHEAALWVVALFLHWVLAPLAVLVVGSGFSAHWWSSPLSSVRPTFSLSPGRSTPAFCRLSFDAAKGMDSGG